MRFTRSILRRIYKTKEADESWDAIGVIFCANIVEINLHKNVGERVKVEEFRETKSNHIKSNHIKSTVVRGFSIDFLISYFVRENVLRLIG